jgi:glycosyltransferase involved in cell wall biosynthesis
LELRKDPGQIPYQLQKEFDYDSTLVSYFFTLEGGRNSGPLTDPPVDDETIYRHYPNLLTEVPGLKIDFLKNKGWGRFYEKAILDYLISHSKKIDILNLFHFNAANIFYTLLYKLLHPGGRVYLKLDIDIPFYKKTKYFFNVPAKFGRLKIFLFTKFIQPLFFRLVHTISAESAAGVNYFSNRFQVPAKKMLLLLNGVDEERISRCLQVTKSFHEKENMIITVGRIGTRQKNNELLLNALSKTDLTHWKVFFIGPIEEAFKPVIDRFFEENPGKKDQVFFTGHIDSPENLYQYYNKAKVFCLTSEDEGFPLSACEAAFFGNYLVLTDSIDCFDELTNKGKHGQKVRQNNVDELAKWLIFIIENPEILVKNFEPMVAYATANLTWQAVIPQLHNRLLLN